MSLIAKAPDRKVIGKNKMNFSLFYDGLSEVLPSKDA